MRKSFIFLGVLVGVVVLLLGGAVGLYFYGSEDGGFSLGEKIGVLEIKGPITTSEEYVDALRKFQRDDSIKAVVLRVNSPGGAVAPSQEIHREVEKTAGLKPVVVSMASLAASGGYYISAPASKIFANPGTIVGSIAVIMKVTNLEDLYKKIGLKVDTLKTGKFKDLGSTSRPMTKAERELLKSLLEDIHTQFMSAVARGRRLPMDKVKKLADGRIFTGEQAKRAGLVDRLGGFQDAVQEAKRLANIKGEPRLKFHERKKTGILDLLMQNMVDAIVTKLLYEEETPRVSYLYTFP